MTPRTVHFQLGPDEGTSCGLSAMHAVNVAVTCARSMVTCEICRAVIVADAEDAVDAAAKERLTALTAWAVSCSPEEQQSLRDGAGKRPAGVGYVDHVQQEIVKWNRAKEAALAGKIVPP